MKFLIHKIQKRGKPLRIFNVMDHMAVVFNETDMSDIFIFNTFLQVQQCESNHYPVIFDGEREKQKTITDTLTDRQTDKERKRH